MVPDVRTKVSAKLSAESAARTGTVPETDNRLRALRVCEDQQVTIPMSRDNRLRACSGTLPGATGYEPLELTVCHSRTTSYSDRTRPSIILHY